MSKDDISTDFKNATGNHGKFTSTKDTTPIIKIPKRQNHDLGDQTKKSDRCWMVERVHVLNTKTHPKKNSEDGAIKI